MIRITIIALGICFVHALSWATPSSLDPLARHYEVNADFLAISQQEFSTLVNLRVTHNGVKPLKELLFILYPGRFRQELPHLNDLDFHRVYPHGVSKGDIYIESITMKDGVDLSHERIGDTEMRVQLPQPLHKGQTIHVLIRSRVTVPEKFGPFGSYRGRTTMSGGWTPYLASYNEAEGFRNEDGPPLADWIIAGQTNQNLLIGDELVSARGETRAFQRRFSQTRSVSLWFSPKVYSETLSGRFLKVEIITFENYRPLSKHFRELVQKWIDFVERQPEFPPPAQKLIMVEAPLRRRLAVRGTPYGYFSDRTFKLVRPLQKYHAIPLVHGLFYQWFFPSANLRETSRDVLWAADALAWRWTERFIQDHRYEHVDARTIPMVRALSFLFTIDRVIYTPQFAFYDVFYDYVYPVDKVRDDPLLFNHERPFGRTIYAHMEDEWGPSIANQVAEDYLKAADLTFSQLTREKVSGSVEPSFTKWMQPRPRVNYVLKEHRQTRVGEFIDHEVDVVRETERPFEEPVELLARTEDGQNHILRWKGSESKHTYRFRTEETLDVLEIDPRHRLWETTLADNRDPPKYKFVVTEYLWTYDFNNNEPTISVAGTFRRSYGGSNRYNLSAGYFGEAYGASVGYSRLFGRVVDSLRLSHGAGMGLSVQRLDSEFVRVVDPITSVPGVVQAGDASWITAFSASYYFGDQLSLTNPLRGGGASISGTWGTKYLGGEASYYRFRLGGSWIFPIHPNHLLAVRGVLGHSGRADIPTQVQYSLGGLGGMKGLSLDDDRFKGRNLLLLGAEYRHFLITDVDIDLFIFQIRDIQGALFTNVGQVTDTVQEKAERLAFGTQTRGHFLDVFDPRDVQSDVGYGIRFFIDYLGVSPSLLTFDVAKSLTEWDTSLRFYFGVTQSF